MALMKIKIREHVEISAMIKVWIRLQHWPPSSPSFPSSSWTPIPRKISVFLSHRKSCSSYLLLMCFQRHLRVIFVIHVCPDELITTSKTDTGVDGCECIVLGRDHETPPRPDGSRDHESTLLRHRYLLRGSKVVCKGSACDTQLCERRPKVRR